jgi:hypothetical protein
MAQIVRAIWHETKRRNPLGVNIYNGAFFACFTALAEIAEAEATHPTAEHAPFLAKYPNIARLLAEDRALHGESSATDPACAEGVDSNDVESLDVWLGTLTPQQRETLLLGEDESFSALLTESPQNARGEHVGMLLNDLWEVL